MSINYSALETAPRLLVEVPLKPLQGDRFQPTGFADLGAARYTLHNGTEMLLIESAQSVANRMELACWDEAVDDLIPELKGLPYILVKKPDGSNLTNSILEAHRINSPYILEGKNKSVFDQIKKDLVPHVAGEKELDEDKSVFNQIKKDAVALEYGPVKLTDLARLVFRYDANAVLHGVFLAKKELAGGRLRMTRCLSGFIEAYNVRIAESGGVKNDRVDPSGDTKTGFGNVPFHRTEFTAEKITAYFNLDLALLRAYGLGENAMQLLTALALFKIQRFLSTGMRLRTACDLALADRVRVTNPTNFEIPGETDLLAECKAKIESCKPFFADPAVTEVIWEPSKKKSKEKEEDTENNAEDE
ncbi:MAG TPA: type I-U CRISPR-associated RAMP protein Csb1/Cas7u [bacterium]|nr:type I-U CRISPR-associated RAMP protein Csb1/Cas7u [bacterium]HQL64036.1 type I-U CRISPR-associated RAMP protein Csb1/Cas7u [bacterium]